MTTEEFIAHATTHPEDLDALFSHIRKTKIREHRFDFNYALAEGRQAEKLVNEILSGGKTVEVKLDNRVSDTGRILIEYAHQYGETSVLSGITTSEADWYAFVFGGEKYRQEVVVMVRSVLVSAFCWLICTFLITAEACWFVRFISDLS